MTHTGTKPRAAPCCPRSSHHTAPVGPGHQQPGWVLPAPHHPQLHPSPEGWGMCGVGSLAPAPGRRAEVAVEERAINTCKYSKEAPGQSCEGHQSVCQQISNPPPQWHLTKCHCE